MLHYQTFLQDANHLTKRRRRSRRHPSAGIAAGVGAVEQLRVPERKPVLAVDFRFLNLKTRT
jgi:hypothetical protein